MPNHRLSKVAFRLWGVVGAVALAGVAGVVLWVTAAHPAIGGGGSGSALFAEVTVSDPSGSGNNTVDVWKNQQTGRETFIWKNNSDAIVLDPAGTTMNQVIDGSVASVDQYPSSSDSWDVINNQFGLTKAVVDTALASGQATTEPSQSSKSTASLVSRDPDSGVVTYISPYSTATHYGLSISGLEANVGFSMPRATSLAGYALVDSSRMQQYGPDSDDSGVVGSLWYGSSTNKFDSLLTVDVAVAAGSSTAWGDIYRSMASGSKDLTGPGYMAKKIDDNQAVFQRGSTYVSVTATWAPTDAEWQSILGTVANS